MTEGRAIRLRALKDAAKDVCSHCATGVAVIRQYPNRWTHVFPDCDASTIWSRIEFEYSSEHCKPEQVKDEGK